MGIGGYTYAAISSVHECENSGVTYMPPPRARMVGFKFQSTPLYFSVLPTCTDTLYGAMFSCSLPKVKPFLYDKEVILKNLASQPLQDAVVPLGWDTHVRMHAHTQTHIHILTHHPWEISQSPPGTRRVKFTTPPSLSLEWIDGMLFCFFFPLLRWSFSPDRGIRFVILLRVCWIGVYCFDLCNNTHFFEWLYVSFLWGIWSWRSSRVGGRGKGCWRRNLEWWWWCVWPSGPEICTPVTEEVPWLHRLTLKRLNGRPELHGARNKGLFQVNQVLYWEQWYHP